MQDLERKLREISAGFRGKWTCAVTDLSSGAHIGVDEDDEMPAASVIKVPVLVALYRAVHDGRIALDDRITYEAHHRCVGTGVLSHLSPGIQMSVRDAATLMIIISDNVATNMCIDLVGRHYINDTSRALGLAKTTLKMRPGDPSPEGPDGRNFAVSTAGEACRLMELLARRQVVSPEACDDMLSILRSQQSRDKLARNLPWNELNLLPGHPNSSVASKDGINAYRGVRTEATVMKGPRGWFALAAFTEGATGCGSGVDFEGNVFLSKLGQAAWEHLAA